MQRPLALSYALALVMTLAPAAGSFGQQGAQQNQQGQGQAQPGNPPSNQQGQDQGQPANSPSNQPGQGQQGNPPPKQQRQGQQGNPGSQKSQRQDQQANQNSFRWSRKTGNVAHDQPWPLLFAYVDESSRNSGMTLAPADAALRAHLRLANNEGLIVTAIEAGSPAASAGIQRNDVLVSLGGDPPDPSISLVTPADLERGLKAHQDTPVSLWLFRGGHRRALRVQPQVRASLGPVHPDPPTYWIGVSVGPVEPALRSQVRIPDGRGLIALEVVADGPAARAGLRVNDILLCYGGVPLSDQAQLTRLVQARGEKAAKVELVRQGLPQALVITPERRTTNVSVHFTEPQTNQYNVVLPGATWQYDLYDTNVVFNEPSGDAAMRVLPNVYVDPVAMAPFLPAADATTRRLEELSAQIKELRQAIEALARAQEKK